MNIISDILYINDKGINVIGRRLYKIKCSAKKKKIRSGIIVGCMIDKTFVSDFQILIDVWLMH